MAKNQAKNSPRSTHSTGSGKAPAATTKAESKFRRGDIIKFKGFLGQDIVGIVMGEQGGETFVSPIFAQHCMKVTGEAEAAELPKLAE